ncbi:hypothetical protein TAMC210_13200 [Thermanaeromonas sp. C210]|nr:hypothetical protein TAMC210_13200 [Thermanaeromonas sp. C210]
MYGLTQRAGGGGRPVKPFTLKFSSEEQAEHGYFHPSVGCAGAPAVKREGVSEKGYGRFSRTFNEVGRWQRPTWVVPRVDAPRPLGWGAFILGSRMKPDGFREVV